MGRRRERRQGTLGGGGGRRVKLDLWEAEEELPCVASGEGVAKDVAGGDESQVDSAGVPSPRQLTGAGPVVENPLSLLGQYSDEDVEEEDEQDQLHDNPSKKQVSAVGLVTASVASAPPMDEQVANFMADLQTSGLLDEENGTDSTRVPPSENGVLCNEGSDSMAGAPTFCCSKDEVLKEKPLSLPTSLDTPMICANGHQPQTVDGPAIVENGAVNVAVERPACCEWKAVLYAESGEYYFWNTVTGETTWEQPALPDLGANGLGSKSMDETEHRVRKCLAGKDACEVDANELTQITSDVVGGNPSEVVKYGNDLETECGRKVKTNELEPAQHMELHASSESCDHGMEEQDTRSGGDVAVSENQATMKPEEEVMVKVCLTLPEDDKKTHPQDEDRGENELVEKTRLDFNDTGNAVQDQEKQTKEFLEWGESVARRLEVHAGEALRSLPLQVRFAVEAWMRLSDCRSLASQGTLQETFREHAENHLRRLEAMIPADLSVAAAEDEHRASVGRILGRNFPSLHAAHSALPLPSGQKPAFRSLRPPVSALQGDTIEKVGDREQHLPAVESDAGGLEGLASACKSSDGQWVIPMSALQALEPSASAYPDVTANAEEEPDRCSVETDTSGPSVNDKEADLEENVIGRVEPARVEEEDHQSTQLSEQVGGDGVLSGLADAGMDVDMEVDMEVDDAAPALASSDATSSYPAVTDPSYPFPIQLGYVASTLVPIAPTLVPRYSVSTVVYPIALSCDVWQPPPLPPDEDWVPPPPPEPDTAAAPPPPDEPPPPSLEYTCDVAALPAPYVADGSSYSYSSAPNMYYYPPPSDGFGTVNGAANGSWAGVVGAESCEPRTTEQPNTSSSKAIAVSSEAALTLSADITGSKKAFKGTRLKKRSHATAVATTLRSNKKVSNLVNKWMAAKEELHESDEDDEDKALYDIKSLEKKRQKEIEEWRRQQLASGGALENANFQPLGVSDWRERVKRAKKVEEKSESADRKQEKPDLKELEKGLPPGWQAFWDSSSGEVYYGNVSTSETTWERPGS